MSRVCRRRLFPPAAEGAVGLDNGEQPVAPRVGQAEFRFKQIAFGIQYFEVAGFASFEACPRHFGDFLLRTDEFGLADDDFTGFAVGIDAVRRFTEGLFCRAFVLSKCFLGACACRVGPGLASPGIEDRPSELGADAVDAGIAVEQVV